MAIDFQSILVLFLLITVMASLYSSVGHGGASGYIAAMALVGLSVLEIKPAALIMNIGVSALVIFFFLRHFEWRLFTPLVIASIPMAYIGGASEVSADFLKIVVGASLVIAAIRMFTAQKEIQAPALPSFGLLLVTGGGLGFVAGLTGVGGAIYLSPVLYAMRWSDMRTNAAVSGGFVFVNSIAGLMGYLSNGQSLPSYSLYFLIAALLGAVIGATLGSRMIGSSSIRKLLGLVLVIAGGKLILTSF